MQFTAKIKARKLYACLIIVNCLSISNLVNLAWAETANPISPTSIASAENLSPKTGADIQYIVITETPTPSPTAKPTPRPTKTPTPKPIPLSGLDEIMERHANKFSINKDLLKRIAHCESRFNTNATNGIYGGLYQFSASSWASARRAMNENPDPALRFNADEAIKTAAFKLSLGHQRIWPNCGK